ncbi:MAG: AAA family ATPase [Planctomycetota bacterium]|nr:AAA family ATPase [Planctomycetota bacterium]
MHRILDLARLRARHGTELQPRQVPRPGAVRARSVCVVSGKGGTGKSVVSGSLARLFARVGPTLLVDGDLGVGNAHILQGVTPRGSLGDQLAGTRRMAELVEPCGHGLDLVAGGSGLAGLANLGAVELARLGDGLAELERDYRYLVLDCGAGISASTLAFARAADLVLVVTTTDLTALTDAYALLKVLGLPPRGPAAQLLVNRAPSEAGARAVHERIDSVARRFLGRGPALLGWCPEDPAVVESVNHRVPLVERSPGAPAAQALAQLAVDLREVLDPCHPRGAGRTLAAGTDPRAAKAARA